MFACSFIDCCHQVKVRILCSWVCMPCLASNAPLLQELYAASFILAMHTTISLASSHFSHGTSCPLHQSRCYWFALLVSTPHGCSYLWLVGPHPGPQRAGISWDGCILLAAEFSMTCNRRYNNIGHALFRSDSLDLWPCL